MFARTDIGENRILRHLYRKATTTLLVGTPFVAVPLILSYATIIFFANRAFWHWSNLGSLTFQVLSLALLSTAFAWVLSHLWFFIRFFISLGYRELCAFFAAAKRVPPAYLEDGRAQVRQLLFHIIALPPDLFIRAGPRSPKQSPFTLFQRAAFLVAP